MQLPAGQLVEVSWQAVNVASGEFDVAFTEGHEWDVAPLPVIVKEAGGNAMRLGQHGSRSGLVVTNRLLALRIGDVL